MEKLLAMHVAAMLTDAACGSSGNNLPVDPDIKDAQVRAKNLQVWETFRIFYRGVVGALADNDSWPSPNISAGSLLPNLIQSLGPLVSGNGPLSGIVNQVLGSLLKPSPQLPASIPDPGVKPAKT